MKRKQIVFTDRIYGKVTIESEVVISLIKSKAFQRLKKISQFGIPDKYYHHKNYYRYEHCIGVMLVLKRLGASDEEQIAGLLHDVSHTAFSHVIDWVIGDGVSENYQDMQHKNVMTSSEVAAILKKHNYDPYALSDYHHFGLLERELPDLCADRIDYSFREFPLNIAKKCLISLTTKNGKIVFKDRETAHLFAHNFLNLQITHWGGFEAVSRYRLLANMLRYALDKKIITFNDFWIDDEFVVKKLVSSKDSHVEHVLSLLKNKSLKHVPTGVIVHKKFRYVDPWFLSNNTIVRLSTVDRSFKQEIERERVNNSRGIAIPSI